MEIYNDGVPPLIFEFLKTEMYDFVPNKRAISATTTLKPVKEILLTQRHREEIRLPASKRFHALFGSATHEILQRLEGDDIEKEQRMAYTFNGMTVSGKFDLIKALKLTDWKTTSFWTVIYADRKEEWRKQLSIYRWLYYKTRKIILSESGSIIAILKDWSESFVKRYKGCPDKPVVEIEMILMSFEEVEDMLKEKIDAIYDAEKLDDDALPACTPEERWFNKKTKKYNKCAGYCPCYEFCTQAHE